ncbi:MAG: hypothetical protein U0103_06095 [Candidatus Obscuribacterales bacterium]
MTNNQLTVPEVSEQHNELVRRDELLQQVLDNPHELAPSVQVRFAKRVGRPGNSRVMMMDAQTSGPIGEEGEDTESKLALRLADGTNVQLSLSFFNENQPALAGVGGGGGGRRTNFAPFNTYMYEPRTYSVNQRESNQLPAIMFAMTFMLGAACYGMLVLTGQVHDQLGILQKLQMSKQITVNALNKPAAAKVAPKVASAKVPTVSLTSARANADTIPEPPPVSLVNNESAKASTKKVHSRSTRSHEQTQITHSSHSQRGEFFVPPPPPMAFNSPPGARGFVPPPPPTPYMVPTGIPAAFDPLQALAPAVAHTNRVYTAPKKVIEPVSMTSTVETKASSSFEAQRSSVPAYASQPPAVQQIAPSSAEKPSVQQYGETPKLQEQQPTYAQN